MKIFGLYSPIVMDWKFWAFHDGEKVCEIHRRDIEALLNAHVPVKNLPKVRVCALIVEEK